MEGSAHSNSQRFERERDAGLKSKLFKPPFLLAPNPLEEGFVDVAALCAALKTQRQVDDFGRRLVALARRARVKRDKQKVDLFSKGILELPVSEHIRNAGVYYSAFGLKSERGSDEAESAISQALKNLDPLYVPRALLELATLRFDAGDLREADTIYRLAARMAHSQDALTFFQACRMLPVVKAVEGDHRGALNAFQALWPLARTLSPASAALEGGLSNSIALELGELGQVEEANRIIDPLLSTPMAASFPEWHLTKADLATMRRPAFMPFSMAIGAPASRQGTTLGQEQTAPETTSGRQGAEPRPPSVLQDSRAYEPLPGDYPLVAARRSGRALTASCTLTGARGAVIPRGDSARGDLRWGTGPFLQEPVDTAALCAALRTQSQVDELARRLVAQASRARVSKDKASVDFFAKIILQLPVGERIRNAGLYYSSFAPKLERRFGDAEHAVHKALENLDPLYVPRALLEVANLRFSVGDLSEADRIYSVTGRAAARRDRLTFYQSCQMRAVINAVVGDHLGALRNFQALWPLARSLGRANPGLAENLLNSIALELGEIGRVEDATRIVDPLIASPLATSFPEWRLTKADLPKMRRRVFPPFALALGAAPQTKRNSRLVRHRAAKRFHPLFEGLIGVLRASSPAPRVPARRAARIEWNASVTIKPRAPPGRVVLAQHIGWLATGRWRTFSAELIRRQAFGLPRYSCAQSGDKPWVAFPVPPYSGSHSLSAARCAPNPLLAFNPALAGKRRGKGLLLPFLWLIPRSSRTASARNPAVAAGAPAGPARKTPERPG